MNTKQGNYVGEKEIAKKNWPYKCSKMGETGEVSLQPGEEDGDDGEVVGEGGWWSQWGSGRNAF